MGINNFQGKFVGTPKASLLKKFPPLPIDCPRIIEGINISIKVFKWTFFDLQKNIIDNNPPIRPPWIAMPPSQTARKEGIGMLLLNSSKEVKKFSPLYCLTQKLRNKL